MKTDEFENSTEPEEMAHSEPLHLILSHSLFALFLLTHCILVDSSTVKCWTSPFCHFCGVKPALSGLFYF